MFELFTERARQVVVLAQDEALTLDHDSIGTILRDAGAGAETIRGTVARVLSGPGHEKG